MAKLTSLKVNLRVAGVVGIEGTWEPDERERNAAWEMYVELVTRISLAELKPDEGLLREALSSLNTLFETTRKILRTYGPSVAKPKGKDNLSFGHISVSILNDVLRPVLSKWHPLLQHHETTRDPSVSALEHEKQWDRYEELRQTLDGVRNVLTAYGNLLAQAAKVPSVMGREGVNTNEGRPQNGMLRKYVLSQIPVYFFASFLFIYLSSLATTEVVSVLPFTNWEMPVFPPKVYLGVGLLTLGWSVFLCIAVCLRQLPDWMRRLHRYTGYIYWILSLVVFIWGWLSALGTVQETMGVAWFHVYSFGGFILFLYLAGQFIWQARK